MPKNENEKSKMHVLECKTENSISQSQLHTCFRSYSKLYFQSTRIYDLRLSVWIELQPRTVHLSFIWPTSSVVERKTSPKSFLEQRQTNIPTSRIHCTNQSVSFSHFLILSDSSYLSVFLSCSFFFDKIVFLSLFLLFSSYISLFFLKLCVSSSPLC